MTEFVTEDAAWEARKTELIKEKVPPSLIDYDEKSFRAGWRYAMNQSEAERVVVRKLLAATTELLEKQQAQLEAKKVGPYPGGTATGGPIYTGGFTGIASGTSPMTVHVGASTAGSAVSSSILSKASPTYSWSSTGTFFIEGSPSE